jgi:ribosomal protein S18 acetylase RimI-like enzyme
MSAARISLRPMSAPEFAAFRRRSQRWYAAAKVRAGNWLASEARARTAALWERLLPQGEVTADQYCRVVELDGRRAGYLWFGIFPDGARRVAYLMDLYVLWPYRRQGVAGAALMLIEQALDGMAVDSLRLEVFAHNRAARALYTRMGFVETNVEMAKPRVVRA